MVDVARFVNLDLLHVHYAIPHAAVAYMAKKILLSEGQYVPVITTLHGTDITLVGKNNAFKPVIEFSINKSDGVTAVSDHLKQLLSKQKISSHNKKECTNKVRGYAKALIKKQVRYPCTKTTK